MPAAEGTRWGFHRLTDTAARTFVARAGVRRGDLVLDVGAGHGAITTQLVNAGARVVAFELHPARAAALRGRFGETTIVVCADAADLRLPTRPFKVVANPPFAITTSLLRRLTAPRSRLLRADLIVPVHVAERWTYGRAPGAGRWRSIFDAHLVGALPRDAFRPPGPRAAVLVIRRRHA